MEIEELIERTQKRAPANYEYKLIANTYKAAVFRLQNRHTEELMSYVVVSIEMPLFMSAYQKEEDAMEFFDQLNKVYVCA